MSINPELKLIAKVLETGDLKTAIDAGLDPDHFVDETCAEYYHYLVEYYTDPEHPRSVPTLELFKDSFPTAILPEADDRTTVEELVAASRNKQLGLVCKQMSDELGYMAEHGNPLNALESAISMASTAVGRSRRTRDISLSSFAERLIDDYMGAKEGRMHGIPWPWKELNTLTRGIEDESFVLIYGRPKNMKCVHGDERIRLKSGELVSMKDLPEEVEVQSYTAGTGKLRWATARKVHSGQKRCLRILTESGFELQAGDEHYYMVPPNEELFEGRFKRAKDLRVGDWVAVTNPIPQPDLPTHSHTYEDVIPYSKNLYDLILQEGGDSMWPETSKGKLFRRNGAITRTLLRKLADAWGSEALRREADQELRWERIKRIEDIGIHDCFDLCIQDGGDPNFIVEGFAVHNTWIANYIGAHFYQTNNRGGRVLFLTLEMSPEQIARRTAALLTGLDYEKFQRGKLSDDEEEVFTAHLEELGAVEQADIYKGRKREFIIASPEEDMSVLEVENKIEAYQPDLTIIDGIYMLADAKSKKASVDWASLAGVSRDLKKLAKRKHSPIIGVHQANRSKDSEADDLEDIAMSDNFGRDPDVIIKCIQIDSFNMGSVIALLFAGAREFKMSGFYVHGKPAMNFRYIQEFGTKDELLSYISKSRKTNTRTAESPNNMLNVSNVVDEMDGRFSKSSDASN